MSRTMKVVAVILGVLRLMPGACYSIFGLVVGGRDGMDLILLLPGACALTFLVIGVSTLPSIGSSEWGSSDVRGMIGIATVGWGFCFLISFGGIMLIRNAIKGVPPRPSDEVQPPAP